MRNHDREIPFYEGEIEVLARKVGRLTFDQTEKFVAALADDLYKQAEADQRRGRVALARTLFNAADNLEDAAVALSESWEISAPHMTPQERGEGSNAPIYNS